MTRGAARLVVGVALFSIMGSPALAHAQAAGTERSLADALGAPRPGVRRERRPERTGGERAGDGDHDDAEEVLFTGPHIELGYTHFQLPDGYGGGAVHAGTFGGYLPTGPLRLGLSADLGVREYALSGDDFLLRGTLLVGYQYLGWLPFAPYVGATVSGGAVFGQRYATTLSWGFGGGGVEAGADLVIARSLFLGLSLGYQRAGIAGSGFDLWILRIRAGL